MSQPSPNARTRSRSRPSARGFSSATRAPCVAISDLLLPSDPEYRVGPGPALPPKRPAPVQPPLAPPEVIGRSSWPHRGACDAAELRTRENTPWLDADSAEVACQRGASSLDHNDARPGPPWSGRASVSRRAHVAERLPTTPLARCPGVLRTNA